MKQLSCDQCRERWDELINKSTFEADPQFADVRAHLESCADCQKTFDLLVATRQELQHFPAQKAPASLRANILGQIEKPQEQHLPWWHSFLVSPQRLAWATGAIVTVFVVALLMRPEHQRPVMQTASQALSNREQVQEHNSAPPQAPIGSQEPNDDLPAEKVLPEKPRATALVKPQKRSHEDSGVSKNLKQQQKSVTPTPKPAPDKEKDSPAPSANKQLLTPPEVQPSLNQGPQKSVAPESPQFAAPAPANNNSAVNELWANDAAGIAKSSSQDSANQQDSMNSSAAKGARGPQGATGSMQVFKAQKVPAIIHWSKTITSDYDVANAKITVTLQEGLTFADDSQSHAERTLWRGTLYRGKQISLNVDLQRSSDHAGKLQLKMINADTQKVLLEKTFDTR